MAEMRERESGVVVEPGGEVIGKMMMTWRRDDDDTLTWLNKMTWHVKWSN